MMFRIMCGCYSVVDLFRYFVDLFRASYCRFLQVRTSQMFKFDYFSTCLFYLLYYFYCFVKFLDLS